jgi:hypothetical protein
MLSSGGPPGQLRTDPWRLPKRCFKIVWVTIKEAADKVAPRFLVEAADAEAGRGSGGPEAVMER